MLNTALWTEAHGNASNLNMPTFMEDFDEEVDTYAIARAMGVTSPALPVKPYVYGQNMSKAALLRELWDRTNPDNPMP